MISQEELGHLWPFYFYAFMRGVMFLTTITIFIFFTEKGLNYTQGGLLVAFSALVVILSELITGSFADAFGRKISVVISLLGDSLIIFGIAMSDSFWQLVVLFGLWGVSNTLSSGADQAWAIDSMAGTEKEHFLDSYYAKNRSFFNAGMIVAGILSSIVLLVSTNQMLWLIRAVLTFLLAVILALFATEKFIQEDHASHVRRTLTNAKTALKYFRNNNILRGLGFASFFTFFAAFLAESIGVQDYKLTAGIPLEWWGILFLVGTFIAIFVPHKAISLSKKFKETKHYIALSYLAVAILYALAILSSNIYFVAIVTILYLSIAEFHIPVEDKLFNKHTPSAQRASINSLRSMIQGAGVIIGIASAGLVTDNFGGAITIAVSAVVIIPAILIVLNMKTSRNRRKT